MSKTNKNDAKNPPANPDDDIPTGSDQDARASVQGNTADVAPRPGAAGEPSQNAVNGAPQDPPTPVAPAKRVPSTNTQGYRGRWEVVKPFHLYWPDNMGGEYRGGAGTVVDFDDPFERDWCDGQGIKFRPVADDAVVTEVKHGMARRIKQRAYEKAHPPKDELKYEPRAGVRTTFAQREG